MRQKHVSLNKIERLYVKTIPNISALLRNPFDWIGHKNSDLALFLKGVKLYAPRRS